jgi:hypothetical protein
MARTKKTAKKRTTKKATLKKGNTASKLKKKNSSVK